MSDDKKTEKPLENPQIYVEVVPRNKTNPAHQEAAKNLEEKLEENVKKALEENKDGGKDKQFRAAEQETKKAGEATSSEKIKKIKVGVGGHDEAGDHEERDWSVNPKEGKPAP